MKYVRTLVALASLAVIAIYAQVAHATACSCNSFAVGQVSITGTGGSLVIGTTTSGVSALSATAYTSGNAAYIEQQTTGTGLYIQASTATYGLNVSGGTGEGVHSDSFIGVKGVGTGNGGSKAIYGYIASNVGTSYSGYFENAASNGYGVYSTSPYIAGEFVSTQTTGTAYGIQAYCASNNCTAGYFYAPSGQTSVYASANVTVSGSLNVYGTKNFVIDHPSKPGMSLQHAAIESSEVLNVYRGRVVVPPSGQASVYMPEWFAKVNANADIMVTCRGANANWSDMANGAFSIAAPPGSKCVWTVMANRNDNFMRANPFQVEVAKRPAPQGVRQ